MCIRDRPSTGRGPGRGIAARVLDLYSVKPVDADGLVASLRAAKDRRVVVEDHYPEGGIGAAVMEALSQAGARPAIAHLAVRDLPGSGKPAELLAEAGIAVRDVIAAARLLVCLLYT